MSTDYQTIVIEWYGPVSLSELETSASGGLYLFSGMQKYERKSKIQYIGITEGRFKQRFTRHHKIKLISREQQCWIGWIKSPEELSRTVLERAESILIFVAKPPLNERKIVRPPRPTAIISHWFDGDGKPRYRGQRILMDFPDVISWDGDHWREGNLKVWDEI